MCTGMQEDNMGIRALTLDYNSGALVLIVQVTWIPKSLSESWVFVWNV